MNIESIKINLTTHKRALINAYAKKENITDTTDLNIMYDVIMDVLEHNSDVKVYDTHLLRSKKR